MSESIHKRHDNTISEFGRRDRETVILRILKETEIHYPEITEYVIKKHLDELTRFTWYMHESTIRLVITYMIFKKGLELGKYVQLKPIQKLLAGDAARKTNILKDMIDARLVKRVNTISEIHIANLVHQSHKYLQPLYKNKQLVKEQEKLHKLAIFKTYDAYKGFQRTHMHVAKALAGMAAYDIMKTNGKKKFLKVILQELFPNEENRIYKVIKDVKHRSNS